MNTGNRANMQEEARNVKNKVRSRNNGRRMAQQPGNQDEELDLPFGMLG